MHSEATSVRCNAKVSLSVACGLEGEAIIRVNTYKAEKPSKILKSLRTQNWSLVDSLV